MASMCQSLHCQNSFSPVPSMSFAMEARLNQQAP